MGIITNGDACDYLALREYQRIGTPDEFRAALRRIAEDDKAREEGLLVELPAPYEADVWVPYHTGILHGNVAMYEHMPQGLFVRVRFAPREVDTLPIATVRFTRQEAEAALEVQK